MVNGFARTTDERHHELRSSRAERNGVAAPWQHGTFRFPLVLQHLRSGNTCLANLREQQRSEVLRHTRSSGVETLLAQWAFQSGLRLRLLTVTTQLRQLGGVPLILDSMIQPSSPHRNGRGVAQAVRRS
jgi:hypothetical protein